VIDQSTFSDWAGSVGLTQDITQGPRLEADAGLEPGRWFIIGINTDWVRTPTGTRHDVSIDAVDLTAFDTDNSSLFFELVMLARAHGSLPVTRIELGPTAARRVLQNITHARLRVQMAGLGVELNVVAHSRHDASGCNTEPPSSNQMLSSAPPAGASTRQNARARW